MKKIYLLALAVIGFSANSFAQSNVAATTASATIVAPISINKVTDMNFGNVAVQNATAGTVILAPAGTRTKTGGVSLPATLGTVTAASFTVTGEGIYTYAITLPTVDVTLISGGNSMIVNTFTSLPSATGALTGGTQTLNVGATLNVSAAQAAGVYLSPSFNVTVNYN